MPAAAAHRTIPFTCVDSVMHVMDERRRPQTIEIEVAVTGTLDEVRLRRAAREAAARHPMARARTVAARPFDLEQAWTIDDQLHGDPVASVVAEGEAPVAAARDRFVSRHLDLETGPPFRVLLLHEPGRGDRVLLSVNHCAFDGVGSLRLLQSISNCYASLPDDTPELDPLEARLLLDERPRSGPGLPAAGAAGPTRLAADPATPAGGFGVLHVDLDAADAAPPAGATVNDLLLAALHLTIERWNTSRGATSGLVTVMMPVNQRPAAWRGEILANLVLAGTVTSTPADRAVAATLLAEVTHQTGRIKADGVPTPAAALPARFPVALRRLVPHVIDAFAGRVADSSVLSNLGRVEDPPWFGSEGRGLWFGPPPRSPLVLTVGAATAGGRLGLSFRWCAGALTPADVQRIADTFVGAVAELRAAHRTT